MGGTSSCVAGQVARKASSGRSLVLQPLGHLAMRTLTMVDWEPTNDPLHCRTMEKSYITNMDFELNFYTILLFVFYSYQNLCEHNFFIMYYA
jgi:hypothetical protein